MKGSYKPKFIEAFMKENFQMDDTVPDLVEIYSEPPSLDNNIQNQFQSLKYRQSKQSKQQPSTRLPHFKQFEHSIQQDFHSLSNKNTRLTNQIQILTTRLQQLNKYTQQLEENKDQQEAVINKITIKNKQLIKRVKQLEDSEQQLRMSNDNIKREVSHYRLQSISSTASPCSVLMTQRSRQISQPKNDKQLKRQIYTKIQDYLKKVIKQFEDKLLNEKLQNSARQKIQGFVEQLLEINSSTIEMAAKSKSIPRMSFVKKENSVIQATPYRSLQSPRGIHNNCNKSAVSGIQHQSKQKHGSRRGDLSNSKQKSFVSKSGLIQISYDWDKSEERQNGRERSKSQRRRRNKIFDRQSPK